MKIIINSNYGGFGIPTQIQEMYLQKKGIDHYWYQQRRPIDWNMPSRYARKDFGDLDLNDFFCAPKAHVKDFGSEVLVSSYDEGCVSDDAWKGTKVDFCDTTYEHNLKEPAGLKIDTRTDPVLIEILEALTPDIIKQVSSVYRPKVVEIPDDVDWTIENYDGMEWVAERHRTWR